MNYLHLSFLKDKLDLKRMVEAELLTSKVIYLTSTEKELLLKNKLNTENYLAKIPAFFKKATKVDLDRAVIESFLPIYNQKIGKTYKQLTQHYLLEASKNTDLAEQPKKLNFIQKIFTKEQNLLNPDSYYNLYYFKPVIEQELDKNNVYVAELLEKLKEIIFQGSDYLELKKAVTDSEFLKTIVLFKKETSNLEFEKLSDKNKQKIFVSTFNKLIKVLEDCLLEQNNKNNSDTQKKPKTANKK